MSSASPPAGRLLLVPNTLDLGATPGDICAVIADGVLQRAAGIRHWVVEDARTARAFLKRVHAVHPLTCALQELGIRELPRARKGSGESIAAATWAELLQPARSGADIGLLSEAGLPAVADPGAALVAAAHGAGILVEVLSGASALLLALAASGLNGQSFAFVGYLPQEQAARATRLRELEQLSRRLGQTQLFIETPYRNAPLLAASLSTLADTTQLSVSCGLTLGNGWTHTATVAQWRQRPPVGTLEHPAVFALLAR
jgi:16S rRNA (cytidine1402-2'-O)-methyltransferase